MKVPKYVAITEKTDQLEPKTPTDPNYKVMPILGLAGEIGSLLAELKKRVREPTRIKRVSKRRLKEELGDILWYAVTVARRAGLDFQQDVMFENLKRIQDNPGIYLPLLDDDDSPGKALRNAIEKDGKRTVENFESYRENAMKSAKFGKDKKALLPYLVKIWKNSGDLLVKLDLQTANFTAKEKPIVAQALGDIMWYVAGFTTLYNLNLNGIAKDNTKKTLSMFRPKDERKRTPLYDTDFPLLEQFPRIFDVIFTPAPWDSEQAIMIVNGLRVGDPLRDNAYKRKKGKKKTKKGEYTIQDNRLIEIDGYRFHDSVHFAFIAILGWSPVMRGLMKRKRKTKGDVDDADDGARAQIVEEMIVKLTHSYAVGIDEDKLLDDEEQVSFDLLKQIKVLADGLEVTGGRKGTQSLKYWEWEKAILAGFHVYNDLRRWRKGRLHVNMTERTIELFELKEGEENFFPGAG